MNSSNKPVLKSNSAFVFAVDNSQSGPHLSGLEPSAEMESGEYISNVFAVSYLRFKKQVVIDHKIIEGPHTGTVLRQWINEVTGNVNPRSAYAKQCAAALGRELAAGDVLDPVSVFKGKNFRVRVGWRMSEKPGGGRYDEKLAMCRKDDSDHLKVHAILGPVEL
jgi:hypothetical protein